MFGYKSGQVMGYVIFFKMLDGKLGKGLYVFINEYVVFSFNLILYSSIIYSLDTKYRFMPFIIFDHVEYFLQNP